jgi:Tc5 transposase DNA-binding domain/helix-turn-helix, Psq domain
VHWDLRHPHQSATKFNETLSTTTMTRAKCPESPEKDARMQQAIAAYKKKQKGSEKASVRAIAKEFEVPRSTLQDRLDGKLARNQAHKPLMHLTKVEETELVHWITTISQRGYAPRYHTIRELAEIIRDQRVLGVNDDDVQLVNYDSIGRNWVSRFLSRHPELKSARRKCIEAARIKDVSVERLIKWFEDLRRVVEGHNIESKNIYNMDESGFAIGDVEASQRIINATIRQQFQAKPGRQEWVTAVECICADGNALSPLIIFKGEKLSNH